MVPVIAPSGDRCLIVEFEASDPFAANRFVRAAAACIEAAALPGVTDVVPALHTVGVHYQPHRVRLSGALLPHLALTEILQSMLADLSLPAVGDARVIELPVCYGGDCGPDLEAVAALCNLRPAQLIELHCAAPVEVLMLGFAPGHPYIGRLDARLSPPRRATPRTVVPAGSLGLANRQTVIYPMNLPGGWHLIGRTPLPLFDARRGSQPCLLRPGDRVRFVPIEPNEFAAMQAGQGGAA
ncbi:5-oxoprolinase subunit PxpB [Pandoraea sp.]|uniref:5-oxoprolinase subunit PxpB n=1 Tax=Pandoraea sp. TaxID=1883445 RepID=UPI00120BCA0A|nr:5-oxoprolinase subunit PxpB [Pandoraea sp.]TAL56893.1 MAG: 5-oxoprolinase subunit PxpB [Pandoraea sp.]TAM17687.1 MAG: 5-oxoprolinase subunit PxpB [Pandoraea sp.]